MAGSSPAMTWWGKVVDAGMRFRQKDCTTPLFSKAMAKVPVAEFPFLVKA